MKKSGKEYGIGKLKKLRLALDVIKNNKKVHSLSHWQQQLAMIDQIFKIPKALDGYVVECGCFNGASTVNLSLACAMVKRSLIVCDSFEGLPDPGKSEKFEVRAGSKDYYSWEKNDFAALGGLNGVKKNVSTYGNIYVCEFVKGYFENTLKPLEEGGKIPEGKVVFVFEDADLVSSVKDCLVNLWPKMQDGCRFYSHEPWSTGVVSIFYDKAFWNEKIGQDPPGFFGSGCGICEGISKLSIGYSEKFDKDKILASGQKRLYEWGR